MKKLAFQNSQHERRRRLLLLLLMGAEARVLGYGGIRLVDRSVGVREATVSVGLDELVRS